MNTHQHRSLFFSLLALALFSVLPWLGEIGFATDNASHGGGLPRPARTLSPISGTAQITITTSGFDPAVLTVTVRTQVTWYNATTTTHTLQSGNIYTKRTLKFADLPL
jgi:hypothetical protein